MGGLIIDIEYGIVFDKFDKIFDEFIEEFERVKRIDNIMKIYGKAIINSLYGRMGMKDRDSESIILNSDEWLEFNKKKNIIQYRVIGDYILAEVKTDRKKRAKGNIAIASAITSKGRIMLYNAQQSVINNGGRLCYSDTDSIFACYNRDVSKEKHGEVD
jgi:DNA polymerase elongation subunit (family B)